MKSERKQRPNSFARRRTTMPATEAAPTSNTEGKPTTEECPAATQEPVAMAACDSAALQARVAQLEKTLERIAPEATSVEEVVAVEKSSSDDKEKSIGDAMTETEEKHVSVSAVEEAAKPVVETPAIGEAAGATTLETEVVVESEAVEIVADAAPTTGVANSDAGAQAEEKAVEMDESEEMMEVVMEEEPEQEPEADYERRLAAIVTRMDRLEAALGKAPSTSIDISALTEAAASAASAAAKAAVAVACATNTHESAVEAAVSTATTRLTDALKTGIATSLQEVTERGVDAHADRLVEMAEKKLNERVELQQTTTEGLQELKEGMEQIGATLASAVGDAEPKKTINGLRRHSIFE